MKPHDPTQAVNDLIYVYKNGFQSGPFGEAEAGDLIEAMGHEGLFFWRPPMVHWRPASEFKRATDQPSSVNLYADPRILVVDDDAIMRELIKLQISSVSRQIETADSVREAQQILTRQPSDHFSCVISDYMMPGQTGLDLVPLIKKHAPRLEVILLTARDDKEIIKEALRLGIFDFLEKPISDQELVRTVLAAVEKTHSNRKSSSDRYRIEHLVGKGGTGSVFKAWDLHLDRPVAFKRLHADEGYSLLEDQALIEEALRLAKLQHPHIVSVFDCGTDQNGPFMVMEMIDGITYEQVISCGETLRGESLRVMICQCLDALEYAHNKGFIHLDLKPSNIMNAKLPGQPIMTKILDFGIAKFVGSGSSSSIEEGAILGSPSYMPPERFAGEEVDGRSDLYSLGCVLYHLVSGIDPFISDDTKTTALNHFENRIRPLKETAKQIDSTTAQWIMSLIRPSMKDRPSSAALAKELLIGKS
ncbi:MAG: protein kinase [Candidatus Methylacidiphilales bacterium]